MPLWDLRGIKRLRDLFDVLLSSVSNGDTLQYESATQKWKNAPAGALGDGSVTNAKLANMANGTIKLRKSSGSGPPEDGTAAELRTILGLAAIATSGSASDLDAGTVPDARFPATLPALSGANLTSVNAATLGGTSLSTLNSSISAKLPLAGGTLTGDLTLTPASGDATLSVKPTHGSSVASALRMYADILGDSPAYPTAVEVWDTGTNALLSRLVIGHGYLAQNVEGGNTWQISESGISGVAFPVALSWDAWAMDLVPTTNVGYSVYRHPSKPIRGPCAKSGSPTLQTGTMCFASRRRVWPWTSYASTGAFKFTFTADDTSDTNAKLTSCTLYGSNDLDTWATVYSDTTARSSSSANGINTVSINAAGLATATVYAYYAVEFGVSVRSGKCVYIGNVEVNGQ